MLSYAALKDNEIRNAKVVTHMFRDLNVIRNLNEGFCMLTSSGTLVFSPLTL